MNDKVSFLILYFICSLFFSCQKNNNAEGTFIPPLPVVSEFEKYKAALAILNDEISSNSSNPENYFKRAQIYWQLNNFKDAKTDIEAALALNKNDAKYRLFNANVLRADGNFKKALEEVKLAELLGAKTPETYIMLADLSQKNNQINEANKYFKFAKEIAPYNGELYYYLGVYDIAKKDTATAIDNFHLAKRLKPRFIDTYKRLSEIYTSQGNTELAKELTIDLAKLYPDDAENCSILAKIYQQRLAIDSALYFYKKAIRLKPSLFQVSYNAGMMSLRNNYYQDALSFFENTYKFAPKTPFINTSIGMCYENMGDKNKALEYYTIAFSLNNRDFKAIEGIKRLEEKPIYVEDPAIYGEILEQNKPINKKPKADTAKIRLIEIQPKKIISPKKDSVNNKLQNSNKFPIPIIK